MHKLKLVIGLGLYAALATVTVVLPGALLLVQQHFRCKAAAG